MALFFGFDQAEGIQIEEAVLDETDLIFGHAAALNIDGDAGEVRGSGVAIDGCGVAIVAAKFFLHFDSADGRVQLDLIVELAVINGGKVGDKVAGPGAAETARGIEARINAQSLTGFDGNKFSRCLQGFELIVILNAGKFEAVDLIVLPEQGIVGWTEQGIPENAAESAETECVQNAMVVRDDAMQGECALRSCDGEGDCEREKRGRERHL